LAKALNIKKPISKGKKDVGKIFGNRKRLGRGNPWHDTRKIEFLTSLIQKEKQT